MPTGTNRDSASGQSIVELVVVLALVGIVVTAVLVGIGQQSTERLQHVQRAFDTRELPVAEPAVTAVGNGDFSSVGRPGDAGGSTNIVLPNQ